MPSFPTARPALACLLGLPLAATLLAAPLTTPAQAATSAAAPVTTALPTAAPAARAVGSERKITYREWASGPQLATGTTDTGAYVAKGAVRLKAGAPVRTVGGRRYAAGTWTSPWTWPGYGLSELVASWDATTPRDSWVRVEVRGRSAGRMSSWDTLAEWTAGDRFRQRTTTSGQDDDLARVNVDTWQASTAAGMHSWQLRATLFRRAGTSSPLPSLDTIGAVASRLPSVSSVPRSAPAGARGVSLAVPSYSQMIHRGHFPQYGNGGEAWCSPTSISMVLGYHRALPGPRAYAWTGGHTDGFVDHAARMTYDYGYRGAGNWPFGTAYAAQHVDNAFVTRLRSLREAERFIKAGIPLVASIKFRAGQLSGAPISSSNGHLLVISGFTRSGDVVVNDPAASSNAGVRRTYDRGQFENAWIPASGGLVYVIRGDKPLPQRMGGSTRNW